MFRFLVLNTSCNIQHVSLLTDLLTHCEEKHRVQTLSTGSVRQNDKCVIP